MKVIFNFFLYSPGGENEGGNQTTDKDLQKDTSEDPTLENREVEPEKTIGEKVKEALQDWSNKDQQDQEFDDTRV